MKKKFDVYRPKNKINWGKTSWEKIPNHPTNGIIIYPFVEKGEPRVIHLEGIDKKRGFGKISVITIIDKKEIWIKNVESAEGSLKSTNIKHAK